MTDFPKLPRIKQDDENMEKIHCAARKGQTELIRRLIAIGIDPNVANKFGCTALHLACKHGQVHAIRELLPRAADLSHPWHGHKLIHLLVQSGNIVALDAFVDLARASGRAVDTIVNELDEYEATEVLGKPKLVQGQTPLHWAIGMRNQPMMRRLIELGANPCSKDKNGETCIVRAIQFQLEAEFEMLVSVPGIRIDTSDRQGRSALHWALHVRNLGMARKLLELGADFMIEDQNKETPLFVAVVTGAVGLGILEGMLARVDHFAFLQMPFHNQIAVQPERIPYHPVVDDATRTETQKALQKKLDVITRDREAAAKQQIADAKAAGTKPPKPAAAGAGGAASAAPVNMTLAPSAPVRRA